MKQTRFFHHNYITKHLWSNNIIILHTGEIYFKLKNQNKSQETGSCNQNAIISIDDVVWETEKYILKTELLFWKKWEKIR